MYSFLIDTPSAGILNIGDTNRTSITIGEVPTPTTIKGALNTTGITTATGQIFPNGGLDTAVGSALNIGTTASKTGAINIGTGLSRTGIIYIGDGNNVSGAIHIGNGTSASNNVNILNGATSTGSVNIGNNTSGTITIGGTGDLVLNGSSIKRKIPITLNYTTLPVFTAEQVGYTIKASKILTIKLSTNAYAVVASINLPIGVWSVSYNIRFGNSPFTTIALIRCQTYFNNNSLTPNFWALQNINTQRLFGGTATELYGVNGSCVITCDTSITLDLYVYCIYIEAPNNSLYISKGEAKCYATRIA